jgi:hypothetical protein
MNLPNLGRGRAAALIVIGLGCLLVAVGLGDQLLPADRADRADQADQAGRADQADQGGQADQADQGDRVGRADQAGPRSAELLVPASEAAWVSFEPGGAPDGRLRAGDTGGGAVTYLKFEVPVSPAPGGPRPRLRLTGAGRPLPGLVELVAVPDTGWDPATLRWENAPMLGPVVQSVRPDQDATVTFDVTGVLGPAAAPGVYAFAVTVPPDHGHAEFVGPGGGPGEPELRLPPGPPTEAFPHRPEPSPDRPQCGVDELLVPSCGVLWGAAPAGHTGSPRVAALAEFEAETGRRQDIYHAYHRAQALFPTEQERAIAAGGRLLFLNWKPLRWSWAQIAAGHPEADSYLDRLADHINRTFPEPFFFTVHHEPENDVRPAAGSGWQAGDYAAMYRYVVERLRSRGVDNLVTVVAYLAYVPWNARPWFPDLYPGDDVVDWIAWDTYAYSDPGYGYGDFAEMMNRRSARYPSWPGFYNWATDQFPGKPFMLAEWGVWYSDRNPGHMARFYDSVARQAPLFPRVKAFVYFDTPGDQRARDSRPAATGAGLAAYRRLGGYPYFQVALTRAGR